MSWYDATPENVARFAAYCAPTALAGLMECSREEAAELIMHANIRGRSVCSVSSNLWHGWLRRELGGVMLPTKRPDAEDRWQAACRRSRFTRSGRVSWAAVARYTVAQFLREHPTKTMILSANGHTVLARGGKIVADSLPKSQMRARVVRATCFPSLEG